MDIISLHWKKKIPKVSFFGSKSDQFPSNIFNKGRYYDEFMVRFRKSTVLIKGDTYHIVMIQEVKTLCNTSFSKKINLILAIIAFWISKLYIYVHMYLRNREYTTTLFFFKSRKNETYCIFSTIHNVTEKIKMTHLDQDFSSFIHITKYPHSDFNICI